MKKSYGFLLTVIFGLLLIYFVPSLHAKVSEILSYSQCDSPTPYKIGTIDPRFNLSSDIAKTDVAEATSVWSTAEGKTLFVYSPKADLTVNFVYDERQALDTQINDLNSKLKTNSQTLLQQKAAYEADVKAFRQKLRAFQETVDRYNARGGAPKDVYDQLIQEQKDLQAEGDALNQRASQLNLSTNDYNSNVSALNQDIAEFKSALAAKPEEGIFDGDSTITIYFTSNKQELIHTLAHEFGHALGMEHVHDENAIMYPYTTKLITVTSDDEQQLAYVCRKQSAIVHNFMVFDLWVIQHIQSLQQSLQKR